ncbi:MAG: hypothetical protein MZU91_11990 [Desulfosudis oleivorans]|nr:hypothetical protein [Desulfosudis oleivorans]
MNADRKKVMILTGSWYWEKVNLLEESGVEVKRVPDGRGGPFLGRMPGRPGGGPRIEHDHPGDDGAVAPPADCRGPRRGLQQRGYRRGR